MHEGRPCTSSSFRVSSSAEGVATKTGNPVDWHCFAATRSLVIKKSGDEERRHLIAVIDFNTQQRDGRGFIGQDESSSTNSDAKEKST